MCSRTLEYGHEKVHVVFVSALGLVSMVAVGSIYVMNKAYYIYAADHRTEARVSTFMSIRATQITERPFVRVR